MGEPFTVHPKRLQEALENSALFTTDKAGLAVNDTVRVGFDGERLVFAGRGRYSCSIHRLTPTKPCLGMPTWDTLINLDQADAAIAALKGVDGIGKKDTTVEVHHLEGGFLVSDGAEPIVSLREDEDSTALRGDEEFSGIFDALDAAEELEAQPLTNERLVWTKGVLAKLAKVKLGSPIRDEDMWSAEWLGGATFRYQMADHESGADFTAYLEATREGFL